MFGFGVKKNMFLGIDIGTSAIKVVELKAEDGKPVLTNYAWMPLDSAMSKSEGEDKYWDVILPEYLRKLLKDAHFSAKNTYAALPAAGGLITLIDFPAMDKGDMEQAIRFEAQKYIPTSLNEVVLSWDTLSEAKKDPKLAGPVEETEKAPADKRENMKIILVAASKNKVKKYEDLIRKIGLKLHSIELESFSMANSLVGNDPGRFVIVDIGARVCNILTVEKGLVTMNRNIDAGGKHITVTIAQGMGIDEARAEKLKMGKNNLFSAEAGLDFPTVDLIISEIKRMIATLSPDPVKNSAVDGVILSGGSANMTGLSQHIGEKLGVKTVIGNALGRISYAKELEPALFDIKTQFSVAVGLAVRGVNEYLKDNK